MKQIAFNSSSTLIKVSGQDFAVIALATEEGFKVDEPAFVHTTKNGSRIVLMAEHFLIVEAENDKSEIAGPYIDLQYANAASYNKLVQEALAEGTRTGAITVVR